MWRAAGVSYLRYSNEMAQVLRQCLREPYREKAMKRGETHLVEKVWANGTVQAKVLISDMQKGFEKIGAAAEAKKEGGPPSWPDLMVFIPFPLTITNGSR
eukprot:CAMPEP_0170621842 /NCGR_PEP_ID=MMETSP0224-20130122/28813_1 /TAXON_ID=285029 /ORGANISM="Togula jolla, Strain CCCM 725" /LENGTH=99 /DNA_ID=CAMNT_0010948121 /DNA_START=73 /DNA_END=370 /DNA_ORIENTATION=-